MFHARFARSFALHTVVLVLALSAPALADPGDCVTEDEQELADLINAYRMQNGQQPVSVSFWLATVAQWHVWDLHVNGPTGGECNLHSWSDARPDLWNAVCYTSDHAQAQEMWDKPRQISDDAYGGNGYEIAYWDLDGATPADALAAWQASSGHDDVILGQGPWAPFQPWPGMGVGIFEDYAVVWFGDQVDPAGGMDPCPVTAIVDAGAPSAERLGLSISPNPIRPSSTISIDLDQGVRAQLTVHDVLGRRVVRLFDGTLSSGRHDFAWDGLMQDGVRAASGVYFLRLDTPGDVVTRRAIIAR